MATNRPVKELRGAARKMWPTRSETLSRRNWVFKGKGLNLDNHYPT